MLLFLVLLFILTHSQCQVNGVDQPCRLGQFWLNFTAGFEPEQPATFTLEGCVNTTFACPAVDVQQIETFPTTGNQVFTLFQGQYSFLFVDTGNGVDCQYYNGYASNFIYLDPDKVNGNTVWKCTFQLPPSTSPTFAPSSSPSQREWEREITLEGDYSSIENVTEFLLECSASLLSTCIDVKPGSIIVTIQGSYTDVGSDEDSIKRNGLTLPTQGSFNIVTPGDGGSSDNSSVTIIITTVVVVLFVVTIGCLYFHYAYRKYTKEIVRRWTTNRVCEWLDEVELAQYKQNFMGKSVDGKMLLMLDDKELKQDFNIGDKHHRRKIMNFIQELQETEGREGDATGALIIAAAEENGSTPGATSADDEGPIDIIDMEHAMDDMEEGGDGKDNVEEGDANDGEGGGKNIGDPAGEKADGDKRRRSTLLSPSMADDDSEDDRASGLYAAEGVNKKSTTHSNPMTPASRASRSSQEQRPLYSDYPSEGSQKQTSPSSRSKEGSISGDKLLPKLKPKKPLRHIIPKRKADRKETLPDLPDETEEHTDVEPGTGEEEGPGKREITAVLSEVVIKKDDSNSEPGTTQDPLHMNFVSDSSIFEVESGTLPAIIQDRQSSKM